MASDQTENTEISLADSLQPATQSSHELSGEVPALSTHSVNDSPFIRRTPFESQVFWTGTKRWSHQNSSTVSLLAGCGVARKKPIPRTVYFPGHMSWREPTIHPGHSSNRSSNRFSMIMLGLNIHDWHTMNPLDSLGDSTESQPKDLQQVGTLQRRRELRKSGMYCARL